MVLTYWSHSVVRQTSFAIPTHLFNNRIVVVSDLSSDWSSDTWHQHILRVFHFFWDPFTNELWAAFFGAFFLNALALYALEWDHEDFEGLSPIRAYFTALYHSIALLPGASSHSPRTLPGRVLYMLWGIILVVVIAW